jgi:site-specific DNA-methyltransferase (cytosine-N4-specific)
MSQLNSKNLKFTYGHQFEPEKFSLAEITKLCEEHQPYRDELEKQILNKYFSKHSQGNNSQKDSSRNQGKLAMNCFLSLRAYKIIEDIEGNRQYQLTNFGKHIVQLSNNNEDIHKIFARHILVNLTGMSLLKAIEAINTRGETPNLELIAYELQEMGFSISPNAIYTSTMRKWLKLGKVLDGEYDINWDIVYELLGANKDYIDQLYTLTSPQKYFLLSMIQLDIQDFKPWNEIAKYAKSRYQIRLPSKTFVKDIIEPLVNLELIKTQKTTSGRGAKPNLVCLTDKSINELVGELINTIAELTDLSNIELNRSFENVIDDLEHPNKHIKGKALELLAIWMIRLTGLRFSQWRLRSYQSTGGGEVDVLAASDRFVYSRWQIQCKNTKKVDVDVLAKEIGITFVTGADVVMVVTTGQFTRDALQYASRMMEVSRYYMILLQKEDIESIKEDKTYIIKILDKQARRVFAKKELELQQEEIDQIELEEEMLSEFNLYEEE